MGQLGRQQQLPPPQQQQPPPQQQQQQPPPQQQQQQQQLRQLQPQQQQQQQQQQSQRGLPSAHQQQFQQQQQVQRAPIQAPAPAPPPVPAPAPAPAPVPLGPQPPVPESTFLFENSKPGLVTLEWDNVAMRDFEQGKIRLSNSVATLIKQGTHLMCKLLDAKDSDESVVKRAAVTGVPTYDPPGPQAPPAHVNVSAADLQGVKTIQSAIHAAEVYGALLRAEVEIGRSVYIVPLDFTQEALGMAELVQLLQTKQIHYVFVKGLPQDCQINAVGECLRKNSWVGPPKESKVSATFGDGQQLDLTVESGSVIASPGTHVALRSRVAAMTLLPDGRLEMPVVESKDIRETDSKTLGAQVNWSDEYLTHSNGWDAAVVQRTVVDHSDVPPQHRLPNQCTRSATWTRHRLDMPNASPEAQAFKSAEAYPVLSGVLICVGMPTDVHYSLSEIPPPGEDSPPVVAAGQAQALHAGLAEAARAVMEGAVAEARADATLVQSVPTTFDELAQYVTQGRVHWDGAHAGDVVFRRVANEGKAALKSVAWRPSLHCQKPEVAIKQLIKPMSPSCEKPIEEIMTAARAIFTGPEPAKKAVAMMLHCLATWSLREARNAGLPLPVVV